jgi:tetratricopeptide (TPR) repeat protein
LLSLDAILGMSYGALPDDATRAAAAALAAFGATPLDFDWAAMAAVWAANEEETARLEQELVASGLLDYDEESERYSLHQTVEAFLALRAEPASYERHAAHYAALLKQHGEQTLLYFKGDVETALAVLDREIRQCERGQRYAAAEVSDFWDVRLIEYAFACDTYFRLRGRYDEHLAWNEFGRVAAQRRGRERDDAMLLNNVAIVYANTGRYEQAIVAYTEAISVYRSLHKEAELAIALGNLGAVYYSQGRYKEALDHYQQSLEIKRQIGDIAGMANTLGNLGIVYADQGRYDEAIDHYQQSLAIAERIGNVVTVAMNYTRIGNIHYQHGRYDEAIVQYQRSLEITRRIGDASTTAMNLYNLGLVYEQQGDLEAARPLFEEAAQIAERIGMPQAAKYRAKMEPGRMTMDE